MENLDKDCLFCKIIRGEIPSYTVFENDDVKAFLDISQVNPGHTLMVPKKHIVNLFDYTKEDAQRYLQYIPEIANAIKAAFPNVTAMNITTNNGKAANQVVMHSHIHFIPHLLMACLGDYHCYLSYRKKLAQLLHQKLCLIRNVSFLTSKIVP